MASATHCASFRIACNFDSFRIPIRYVIDLWYEVYGKNLILWVFSDDLFSQRYTWNWNQRCVNVCIALRYFAAVMPRVTLFLQNTESISQLRI